MTDKPRTPQAFRIDPATETKTERAAKPRVKIEFHEAEEPQLPAEAPMAEANARRRGFRWGYLLLTCLLALGSLGLSLSVTHLIEQLFQWSLTLGWLSVALAGLAGLAFVMIIAREIWGLMRLRRIEHLQVLTARAMNQNDAVASKEALHGLKNLYAARPDRAWAVKAWSEHERDIIDPPGAVRLAERMLLEDLDEMAHRLIAQRARRVTLLTTVTPTAALDILLVGSQNLFMVREIAELYGGRPSFVATIRLARMVATHLAVTAGLALSDNFLHLFVGKGLLGKLSTRFGEGAINGILTSRIGLAAMDVCRPIASRQPRRETLASLIKQLAGMDGSGQTDRSP